MKTSKVLLCSCYTVYGVSGGRENRLDVTNPHTERFFKHWKIAPLWVLVQAKYILKFTRSMRKWLSCVSFFFQTKAIIWDHILIQKPKYNLPAKAEQYSFHAYWFHSEQGCIIILGSIWLQFTFFHDCNFMKFWRIRLW